MTDIRSGRRWHCQSTRYEAQTVSKSFLTGSAFIMTHRGWVTSTCRPQPTPWSPCNSPRPTGEVWHVWPSHDWPLSWPSTASSPASSSAFSPWTWSSLPWHSGWLSVISDGEDNLFVEFSTDQKSLGCLPTLVYSYSHTSFGRRLLRRVFKFLLLALFLLAGLIGMLYHSLYIRNGVVALSLLNINGLIFISFFYVFSLGFHLLKYKVQT